MKQENDLWLKKIKTQLRDYSEPLPAGGWERLEQSLSAPKTPSVPTRKGWWSRRWEWAAVAAIFITTFLITWWVLRTPVVDVHRSAEPALAVMPDALPQPPVPDEGLASPIPVVKQQHRTAHISRTPISEEKPSIIYKEGSAANNEVGATNSGVGATNSDASATNSGVGTKEAATAPSTQQQPDAAQESTALTGQQPKYRPSGTLNLPDRKKNLTAQAAKWAVGLSVGNTGTGSSVNNGMDNAILALHPPMMSAKQSGKPDLADTKDDGIVEIPEGQDVYFENGVPFYSKETAQVKDIRHSMPISVGVSFRRGLGSGFSVETGLMYTYLSSEIEYSNAEKSNQNLHYIGIPLRANWNFVSRNRWGLYLSAGGAVEKSVYGKSGDQRLNVKPLQFSLLGVIGAQYNLTKRIGIYLEPGVSYYFDDGSDVETIRKKNPLNFTLQAGFRLTY
ncbi:MAG: PorT family protein [Prevotellaceae bacterium]|jgi:hypothetical protein|nr:PorT family protein [Prevotellaceae bacterium]